MTFNRLKRRRLAERGARRHPDSGARRAFHMLFFALAAVLLLSVMAGLRDLNSRDGLGPVAAEPSPVDRAEAVQLPGEPSDNARERILSDPHGKSAVPADESIQIPQQR